MQQIIDTLEQLAHQLPLEWFVFIGSFVEEFIAPIPALLVLTPAGIAAEIQGITALHMIVLVVIAAIGRILATLIFYVFADKLEDRLFRQGKQFMGITHHDIERVSHQLRRSSKDWLILFGLNALPIAPSGVVALGCGFLKIKLSVFLSATFLGSLISGGFYLLVGYFGIRVTQTLQHIEIASQILFGIALLLLVAYLVKRRQVLAQRNNK